MSDLKRRMAKGAAWMVLFRFVDRGIGLVSTLILARLLVPGDFGLLAMATTIIAMLDMLAAYSFETALIQNQRAERSHYDTAFTLNLLLALSKAVLLVALAWPAAEFYGEPRLVPVMLALALCLAANGLENIGIVSFQKDLEFDKEFKLGLYRRVAGFVTTVGVAWWLQSYWALIAGITVTRLVAVLLSYTMHPYRPHLSLERAGELFSFSKWLLLNNVLITINNRGADLVVGKVSGTHALGLFSVSYELANLPTTELVHPIQRAVFPGYSQMAADLERLRQTFLQVIGLIAVLTLPVGLLIGALAEPFVMALLGPKWVEAVPLVELLALFGLVRTLHGPTGSIYLALGRPRLIAFFAVVQLVLSLGLMLAWVPSQGAWGAALSILVGAIAAMAFNYALLFRHLQLVPWALVLELWRPLLAGGLMTVVVVAARSAWPASESMLGAMAKLVVLGLAGLLAYGMLLSLFWRLSAKPAGAESLLARELATRWNALAGKT